MVNRDKRAKSFVGFYLTHPKNIDALSRAIGFQISEMGVDPLSAVRVLRDVLESGSDHPTLPEPGDRLKLQAIIGGIFEMCGFERAGSYWYECGFTRDRRHTLTETAFHDIFHYRGNPTMTFSEYFMSAKRPMPVTLAGDGGEPDKENPVLYLGEERDLNNVLRICREEPILAYREAGGRICVAYLSHVNDSILVDEERYCDEPPMYFTMSTHFRSPVDKLKVFRAILRKILNLIGYPPVKIDYKVFFCGRKAELMDREKYDPDGEEEEQWQGIEVLERHRMKGRPFIGPTVPLQEKGTDVDWQFMDTLMVLSLSAAGKVWESLRNEMDAETINVHRIEVEIDTLGIFQQEMRH